MHQEKSPETDDSYFSKHGTPKFVAGIGPIRPNPRLDLYYLENEKVVLFFVNKNEISKQKVGF